MEVEAPYLRGFFFLFERILNDNMFSGLSFTGMLSFGDLFSQFIFRHKIAGLRTLSDSCYQAMQKTFMVTHVGKENNVHIFASLPSG